MYRQRSLALVHNPLPDLLPEVGEFDADMTDRLALGAASATEQRIDELLVDLDLAA